MEADGEQMAIDRTALVHAHGPAAEILSRLAALHGNDPEATSATAAFLWSHLLDGDRLTPATAPPMRRLAGMLEDPALDAGDNGIRDSALYLIREIARIATAADHADAAVAACADLMPEVFATLWPIPDGWAPSTRATAGSAAVMLVRHPALAERRREVIAFHEHEARAATDRRTRASYVIGLGELGEAPRAWLDDPWLAVRTCAALAPALAADDTAINLLVRAAERPRAFDHSFGEPFAAPADRLTVPPQLQGLPHRYLIRTVCERVTDFARLATAAVAAVDLPEPAFGPYLPIAFPGGLPADRTATWHQAQFAQAIADCDDLGDGTGHGVPEMLAGRGLPPDRDSWHGVRVAETRDADGRPVYDTSHLIVLAGDQAVRKRPQMYIGATRTSPDLLPSLLTALARADVAVRVTAPLRFTAEVDGPALTPSTVQAIATVALLGNPPYFGLCLAAAFSFRVSVCWWVDGVAYRQQFVDRTSAGPPESLGPADRPDGFRIDFELDREWLPAGAHLPS